ncbi:MAG: 3-deoxy-manno-octulosonate cytidylyltransferase [Rhodospirillales bacterium]|nr:3-deoxy-manno-octulosonate cytidylyltransferase [Rhodospirillales bacterium]
MKIIGIIPARMAASRFPGKPLHPIAGRPMIEHCFERAKMFGRWDGLFLATCDQEIKAFAEEKDYPVLMTADTHTRALDRVAEAAEKSGQDLADNDIVVCVQGDEPLLGEDVIEAVVAPLENDPEIDGTMLAVPIVDKEIYLNPDIVKIVNDQKGDVLYTSRAPIPYCKEFTPQLGAKRVGGIFGFRWAFLKWFTGIPESPLEIVESCDSNRICDNGFRQRIAPVPYRPYFSVDSPEDVALVEAALKTDPLWGKY